MSDLRDHRQSCGHSEFDRYKVGYPEVWMCRVAACPGGREVTEADLQTMIEAFLQTARNAAIGRPE